MDLLPATRRENLITVTLATWLVFGLFVDGWAHNNQPELESFFTPWHAIFYSGFTATALWMVWVIRQRITPERSLQDAIPPGYGLGVIGLGLFGIGGVGDGFWHTIFGIETSFDALLSPTHILLFVGALLILTAPYRSVSIQHSGRVLPPGEFRPAGISYGLTTLLIAFFFMYAYAPAHLFPTGRFIPNVAGGFEAEFGLLQMIVTTILVGATTLFLATRFRTPRFTFTLIHGLVGLGIISMLRELDPVWLIIAPFAVGAFADLMVARFDPHPERKGLWLVFGAAVPFVLWSVFMAQIAIFAEMGWTVELWAGIPVLGAIIGVAMAVVIGATPTSLAQDGAETAPARSSSSRPVGS